MEYGTGHPNSYENDTYSKELIDTETMNKDGTHTDEEWKKYNETFSSTTTWQNNKQKNSRDIESEPEIDANEVTPNKRRPRRNKKLTPSCNESTSDAEQKEECVETDGNDSYESNSRDGDDSDYNNINDQDSSSESVSSSSSDCRRVRTSNMSSTRRAVKNTSASSRSIIKYRDTFSTTNDNKDKLNFRKYEDSHEKQRRRTKQSKLKINNNKKSKTYNKYFFLWIILFLDISLVLNLQYLIYMINIVYFSHNLK